MKPLKDAVKTVCNLLVKRQACFVKNRLDVEKYAGNISSALATVKRNPRKEKLPGVK